MTDPADKLTPADPRDLADAFGLRPALQRAQARPQRRWDHVGDRGEAPRWAFRAGTILGGETVPRDLGGSPSSTRLRPCGSISKLVIWPTRPSPTLTISTGPFTPP